MTDGPNDNDYGWEITIDTTQSSYNPRMKIRDGHFPTADEIEQCIKSFALLHERLSVRGWKVAPIK